MACLFVSLSQGGQVVNSVVPYRPSMACRVIEELIGLFRR